MTNAHNHHGDGDHGHQDHPGRNAEFCFLFDDGRFKSPDHVVTPARIRQIVGGIPEDTAIVQVEEDGTQVTLQEGQEIRLVTCVQLRHLPRFTRGRRADTDLKLLKRAYPSAHIGPDAGHFIIPDFPLPPGLYTQARTAVLVIIPPTYPTAPPDNFHIAWGLSLASGGAIGAYSGPVDLHGHRWGTFSHHLSAEHWKPGETAETGDNLVSFVSTVHARLREGA